MWNRDERDTRRETEKQNWTDRNKVRQRETESEIEREREEGKKNERHRD